MADRQDRARRDHASIPFDGCHQRAQRVGGREGLGWHWIFWINMPVAAAAIPLVLSRLPEAWGALFFVDDLEGRWLDDDRRAQVPARPLASRPLPDVAGVEHRYIETRRLRIHIAEAGSGPPLLMLHGWPQHWYAWRKLIPLLASSHRLICADLRGFGWSDAPAAGYRTADLAADALALLDALELDRVDVIGQSEGGRVGFELSFNQPERVRRLVTLGAMHPYPSLRLAAPTAWRFWWTPLVETSWLGRRVVRHAPRVTQAVLRVSAGNSAALSNDVIEEYVASVREPARARASERMMHDFAYREMIPELLGANRSRPLRVPALMLNGERDFFVPARALRAPVLSADDLRIQVIAGASHLLAEECPQTVAAAVRAFLQ